MNEQKNTFDIFTLQAEIDSIAEDIGKQKTRSDYHDWLVRLYKAGAMLALVWKQYDLHPAHNSVERKAEKEMLSQIPGTMESLNIQIMQAIINLKNAGR